MLDYAIKQIIKCEKSSYKKIYKAIKKYDKIVIFRHEMPDFDALGSQLGLYTWIKDNFKEKEVHVVGENHVTFTPRLFPYMEDVSDQWFEENKFLAIVVDTANVKRVSDKRFMKAETIVKIDHHPNHEPYGDIVIVHDELASCAELVANMVISFNKHLSKEASIYFYAGIAGDSGRFLYSSTSTHTFAIARILLENDIDLSRDIYQKMYRKDIEDLKVTAYVLNEFKVSKGGVCYYVLPIDVQEKLNITVERGKENINLFANIDGINAWCSITQDVKKNEWRVSIRSKSKPINEVASRFGGGGHDQAAGCHLNDISELDSLIDELDKLFL